MDFMNVNLREIFNPATVAQDLLSLPALPTRMLDTYYPVESRSQWPFPVIGIDEITKTVGTVPVVSRGAPAVNVEGDTASRQYIEPSGIDVKTFVSAKELNDVKVLIAQGNQNGVDALAIWRQSKEDSLRRFVRYTTDALAAQSLSGLISYPMKLENGQFATYTINFGSILSYTISTKWGTAQLTLATIMLDLIGMATKLQENGYGSNIRWEIGSSVFATLCAIITALPNDNRVNATINEKGIQIGGFTLVLVAGSYKDPQTGASTPYLGAKEVRAIDMAAPRKLWYLALDDIDADLQPRPFFINPVESKDPSGYTLIGRSKPVPAPVVKAICLATAL